MAKPWTNADGLQVEFGNFWSDPKNFVNRARSVSKLGFVKELVVDVDLKRIASGTVSYTADLNNDGTADGFSDHDAAIPANASVLDTIFVSTETAAGGTSLKVGIFKKDGTAVDDDFMVTATEGVTANFTLGKRVYGAGAGVATTAGTAGVGANNVYVGLTATGTFTAGKGFLVIRYIEGAAASVSND
jgi:hypothetical protein